MEKTTIKEVCDDLKSKRDALMTYHEFLKAENDKWNGIIIVLSLIMGCLESVKIKLKIDNDFMALLPVLMSSVVASISALIKFKKYPETMEIVVQSSSLLTNTLTKCRNHEELDPEIKHEYIQALEKIETSMYPDLRKKFMKISHRNLLCIMKQEQDYFKGITKVNNGEKLDIKCDTDSETNSTSTENILVDNQDIENQRGEKMNETYEYDVSQSPPSNRKLPQIKEEF